VLTLIQGKEHEIVESLAKYVADEYDNKLKEKVDTSEWTRRYVGTLASCMHVAYS
jgi:hypothetical protein